MTQQSPRSIDIARAARLVAAVRAHDSADFAAVYDDIVSEENLGTFAGRPVLAVINALAERVARLMDESVTVAAVEAEQTLKEALDEMPQLIFPGEGDVNEPSS